MQSSVYNAIDFYKIIVWLWQPADSIKPGYCMRINTGAPLPPGADAVVQVEDTVLVRDADDGRIEVEIKIMSLPKAGQDIR